MSNLIGQIELLIRRSKVDYALVLAAVIVVAVIAAVILGPHIQNSYNNMVPNGSQ